MSQVWTPTRVGGGKEPFPRSHHTASEFNGKIYIFGGKDNQGQLSDNELQVLNTAGLKAWNVPKTTGVVPAQRHSHTATLVDKRIFVFGGYGQRYYNDLIILNCATLVWSKPRVNGAGPSPRSSHSAVTDGKDKIYVFGGSYLKSASNDLHIFDVASLTWIVGNPTGEIPTPRHSHAAALIDKEMFVIGGSDGKGILLNDVYVLNVDTMVWSKPPQFQSYFSPRKDAATASLWKTIFLWGGVAADGSTLSDLYALDLEKGKWRISTTSDSVPREGHTATFSKQLIYLLGGYSSSTPAVTGLIVIDPSKLEYSDATLSTSSSQTPRPHIESVPKQEQLLPQLSSQPSQPPQPSPTSLSSSFQQENLVSMPELNKNVRSEELEKFTAELQALKVKHEQAATRRAERDKEKKDPVASEAEIKLREKDEELKRLKLQYDQSVEEIQSLNTLISKLQSSAQENKSMNQAFEEQKSLHHKALNEVQTLRNKLQQEENNKNVQSLRDQELIQQIQLLQQKNEDEARFRQEEADKAVQLEIQLKRSSKELDELKFEKEAALLKLKNEKEQLQIKLTKEKEDKEFALKGEIERLMLKQVEQSGIQSEKLVHDLEEKLKKQTAEIETLTAELRQKDQTNSTSQSQLNSLLLESSRTKALFDSVSKELALFQAKYDKEVANVAAKDKILSELTNKISELEKKASENVVGKEKIAQLQTQLAENETELSSMKQSLASANSLLSQQERECSALRVETQRQKQELQQKQQQIQDLQTQLQKEKESNASAATSEDLVALQEEVQRLNSALQELETKYEKAIEENDQLLIKYNEAKKQKAAPASAGDHSALIEELSRRLEEVEALLFEKNQEKEKLESEVEQWMAASEQLQKLGEDAVKEVSEESEKLREEVSLWQQAYEKEVQRRRDAESELASSEAKLNDLDNMLQRLMSFT